MLASREFMIAWMIRSAFTGRDLFRVPLLVEEDRSFFELVTSRFIFLEAFDNLVELFCFLSIFEGSKIK